MFNFAIVIGTYTNREALIPLTYVKSNTHGGTLETNFN